MNCARSIFYLFVAIDTVRSNFYHEIYADKSIQEILRSIVRQDVIIRFRERDMSDRVKHLLEIVTRTVITTWPSQIVSERIESRSQSVASSNTLMIYIYVSDSNISHAGLNIMAKEIRSMSHPKHVPRLFLIHSSGTEDHVLDAPNQLKYLWKQGFLDAIIMEVSFSGPKYLEPVFVAVHRFNGFNEDYSRLTAYNDSIDWYPDKLRDMQGSAFRVSFNAARPYGGLKPGNDRLDGLAKTFADVLTIIMNTTVISTRFMRESDLMYNAEELMYTSWYSTNYEHTVVVDEDRVCLLLPRLSTATLLIDSSHIVVAILIGCLLTAIVWCISRILTVNERIRDPLNTISLLFCITPAYQPSSLVEKILFVTVIATAAEYTFIFQTELLRFATEYVDDVHVLTLQDLFETGLQILVSATVYNEIATMDDLSPAFLDRFTVAVFEENHESLDISKAYFMPRIDGKLTEMARVDCKGKRFFRLCDLCIMRFNRVHALPVRSPYKSGVNSALLILTEYGFAKKHIDDFWQNAGAKRIESELVISDRSIYFLALLFVLAGFLISLVVFAGELIAGLFRIGKHSIRNKSPRMLQAVKNVEKLENSAAINFMT